MSESVSILNTTQRAYLRGEHEPADNARERRLRMEIRDRLIQAFHDFALIDTELASDDKEQVFAKAFGEPLSGQPRTEPDYEHLKFYYGTEVDKGEPYVLNGLEGLISFLYHGLSTNGFSTVDVERLLEHGLRRALRSESTRASVEVTIEITRDIDPEHLYERWTAGDDLSAAEVGRLVAWDGFDSEDLARLQTDSTP